MFILMYLALLIIVYVVTFKNDFSDEHIAKVTPFLVVVVSVLFIIGILGSVVRR